MTSEQELQELLYYYKLDILSKNEEHAQRGYDAIIKFFDNTRPASEPRWIPVSERLPDNYVTVLISFPFRSGIYFGSYMSGDWHYKQNGWERCKSSPTHWMPLPQPPTQSPISPETSVKGDEGEE